MAKWRGKGALRVVAPAGRGVWGLSLGEDFVRRLSKLNFSANVKEF